MSDFIINLSQVVRVFPLFFVALLVAVLWFGLMSVLKFTTAIFQKNKTDQSLKSPAHYWGWAALLPLALFLSLVIHPTPLKFRQERRIAFERVENAGGWDAIKRDACLLTNEQGYAFSWFRHSTNFSELPPALAALKPIRVEGFVDEKLHAPIVRIHVLGISDTDRSEPYFGFWIVCGPTPNGYRPKFDFGSRSFQGKSLLITNSVFEIF